MALMDKPDTVDPISGNEVPKGSSAEEVRDDIPAKLSEGEYVIPANVVRFHGVKFFDNLIKKAEEKIEEAYTDDDTPRAMRDELPFSDEELLAIDDEAPVEMAEGGPVFNPEDWRFGSPGGGMGGFGGVELRQYRNQAGNTISIMFVNGTPIQAIPNGYYPATPQDTQPTNTQEVTHEDENTTSVNPNEADTQFENAQKPVSEWSVDDYQNFLDQQNFVQAASLAFTAAGTPIGMAMRAGNNRTKRVAREQLTDLVNNPELSEEERKSYKELLDEYGGPAEKKGGKGVIRGILDDLFGNRQQQRTTSSEGTTSTPSAPVSYTPVSGPSEDREPVDLTEGRLTEEESSTDSTLPSGSSPVTSPQPPSRPSSISDDPNPDEYGDWVNDSPSFNKGGFVTRKATRQKTTSKKGTLVRRPQKRK